MIKMNYCTKLLIPAVTAAFFAAPVSAANCTNDSSGNWNSRGTWGTNTFGCIGAPGGIPGAADNVTVAGANATVTIPTGYAAAANSVTVGNASSSRLSSLRFNAASSSLTVTNNVTIAAATSTTAGRDRQILVNAGTLIVNGSVTLNGSTRSQTYGLLTLTTGTVSIAGGLSVVSNTATAGRAVVTVGTGTINVNGAAGVTNGDLITVGAGTFNVTNPAATFTNSNATIGANTTVSTGTLNVSGNLTNAAATDAVTVSSTGNVTVGGILTNNGIVTLAATGTVNANGDFINSATGVFTNTATGLLNIGGNATVDGTFNPGTGKVVCNGTTAQNLAGSALTSPDIGLNDLETSNANGVTLGNNVTVNGSLTLTSGTVTTGTNTLITSANCPASLSRTGGHVVGNLQLAFPAGASTCSYYLGDSFGYAPATVALTGATAGTLTGRVDSDDHPDTIANFSRIDQTKSANRYWTLTPGTLATYTNYDATLQFGAAIDATAGTGNFIIAKKFPVATGPWMRPTVGARTATTIQATGITSAQGFGAFTVGEPLVGVYKGVNQLIDLREMY